MNNSRKAPGNGSKPATKRKPAGNGSKPPTKRKPAVAVKETQPAPGSDGNQAITPAAGHSQNDSASFERQILDLTPAGALITRISDGIILFANRSIGDMLGIKDVHSIIGTPVPNFYWDPEERKTVVGRFRTEGYLRNYELRTRRADGSMFWISLSMSSFQFEGETTLLSTIVDITDRKQAENAVRESEDRFRRFTEATNEGLVFHEVGKIVDANPAILAMFGLSDITEIIGRSLLEFVVPADHAQVLKQMQLETVLPYEVQCIRKDGSTFPIETSTHTYKVGDRTVRATSVSDITERKHAEEAIKAEQQRFQTILESVRVPLIISRLSDKQVLYANQALAQVSHVSLDKLIGFPTSNFYADSDAQKTVIKNLQQHGYISDFEVQFRRTDGSLYWALLSSRIMDYQGETCVFSSYVDITERKNLEQQLQTAFERRGRQVQLSTQVSQSIATASSLEELYQRVVTQVKEQFGYYHTQILRYDAAQEAVVLVSGYGETGAQMLAAGHRLPMGEGLIGTAASTGETVLRPALENDPDWRPNPLLPDTKGEIAVPIKLGNNILGVLDVQSNEAGTLGADDQLLLEGLCGQIATAIESTRLRQEMADRLEEINRLYRAMSHEGWQAYRETADFSTGFMFDQAGTRPVENSGLTEELFAKIPLTVLGGEVIGTLAVADDPQRPISPEDQTFLQQISEQVTLALESARLFDQTQVALSEVARRASELETVARVSATISTVLDPDTLLQSVVDLTKERFGLYHAHIYLADEAWKTLLLSAGAGEVGRKMVAEEHAIAFNMKKSLVARAARERQAVIVNDVHSEPGFLPNPLLPETRSEMAVPMIVGDKILGVFDVQSDKLGGFAKEDANIYTTLAAQVAVALQNARLYAEQAATLAQLRELDRLKTSFLANMSHELRTPLNSILGFADVVLDELDGPLTENMTNDIQVIRKNGQHLLSLINNVLDMAKIEAGKMSISLEHFKLHDVLKDVISITSPMINDEVLSLHLEDDSDQETEIEADRIRIRQVMLNLVGNAAKFTEKGEISIRADRQGDHMLIQVRDTGVGISPDKQGLVFQEFTQVDSSSTRKVGGTGLGLPISRRLIEMHSGRLWVESTGIPGEGSTFFVELPIQAKVTEPIEKREK